MRGRAFRRDERSKAVKRASKFRSIPPWVLNVPYEFEPYKVSEDRGDHCFNSTRVLGMRAKTAAPCSCYLCGNQRKYGKGEMRLSMQERRAKISDKDSE